MNLFKRWFSCSKGIHSSNMLISLCLPDGTYYTYYRCDHCNNYRVSGGRDKCHPSMPLKLAYKELPAYHMRILKCLDIVPPNFFI